RALARALAVALAMPALATAQAPGLPVLQNAFNNPGLAVAANFGTGSGQGFYGAAAAWGLGSGRLSVSGAAGAQRGNGATRGAYGGRLAASAWTSSGGGLSVGGFVGMGGAPRTRAGQVVTNPAVMSVPAGVSLGYRRALGRSRGLSGYVSPFYRWTRTDSAAIESSGAFRISGGIDFAISPSLGATIGGELGGGAKSGGSNRGSSLLGAAISFVPGRR
ncbi:MAG: hypothetical protein WD825_10400, partial [Gemmatimonadaceae bacterium]